MATLTVLKPDYSRRRKNNRFQWALTAAYTTGGVVLDLTTAVNPTFQPNVGISGFDIPPITDFTITRYAGGYIAEIVAGTDPTVLATAYRLKIFSAPGTELAAAALPAPITADFYEFILNTDTFKQ